MEATATSCHSGSLASDKKPRCGSWDNPEATCHSRSQAQDLRSPLTAMEARTRRETIQRSALRTETWAGRTGWTLMAGSVQRPQGAPACYWGLSHCHPAAHYPRPDRVGGCKGSGGVEQLVQCNGSKFGNKSEQDRALDPAPPAHIYAVLYHFFFLRRLPFIRPRCPT